MKMKMKLTQMLLLELLLLLLLYIHYVCIGGTLRAPLYVHDKIHTAEAAAAEAAAEPELGKDVVT